MTALSGTAPAGSEQMRVKLTNGETRIVTADSFRETDDGVMVLFLDDAGTLVTALAKYRIESIETGVGASDE